MANYLDKWKTDFPETVNNQTRPANGIDNSLAFNTDGFPQRITSDPVHAKLENDMAQQLFSNDQRLKEAIDSAGTKESDHEKASNAHTNGIAGNAGSATKLATARTIQTNLASTTAVSFNGTANVTPGVTGTLPVGNGGTGQTNLDNVTVGTSKKVHTTVSSGAVGELLKATMGDNDAFRIAVGGSTNARYAEIATADDGTEPIYVRQYGDDKSDGFVTPTRTATLLDASGNTQFPGSVTAPSFVGNASSADKWETARTLSLSGRAAGSVSMDGSANATLNVTDVGLADKATADANGNNISDTYFKYTGKTSMAGDGSLWTRNGTKEYLQALPDALSGAYNYGQCISFATPDNRLDVYASHTASNGDGLYYRSGYGTDKKGWARILDSGNYNNFVPTKSGNGATGTWPISVSGNAATATNADKLGGYHASDLISKIQDITPKTAAALGQFRELIVNDSHQIKLPDGGTWAYFVYCYTSWSGDDSNGEHRTRTGAGIAAGGTVLHTDGGINSSTINNFHLTGTTSAGGADGNNMIVGGFCWRIA